MEWMTNDFAMTSTGNDSHVIQLNANAFRNREKLAEEYQKLVDKKSLYSSTLQKIPAPNFIEFYNGSTAIADCTELSAFLSI